MNSILSAAWNIVTSEPDTSPREYVFKVLLHLVALFSVVGGEWIEWFSVLYLLQAILEFPLLFFPLIQTSITEYYLNFIQKWVAFTVYFQMILTDATLVYWIHNGGTDMALFPSFALCFSNTINACLFTLFCIYKTKKYSNLIRNGVFSFMDDIVSNYDEEEEEEEDLTVDQIESVVNAPVQATEDDCPICLTKLSDKLMMAMPCGHTFHMACLIKSLFSSRQCPLCRRDIPRPEPSEE